MAELQRRRGPEPLFEVVFNYTHFHVYGELSGEEQSQVQGRTGYAATEFALVANFVVPPAVASSCSRWKGRGGSST
jgi:hypothetical protein